MNKLVTEYNILNQAIDAIHRDVGLRMDIIERDIKEDGKYIDAIIEMPENGVRFVVEIKKWANQANLGAVINQIKNIAELYQGQGHGLFVADYINPNMGDRLKQADIQFIDTVGNAYINQKPLYIYIKGNKPQQDIAIIKKLKTGRAFQTTGMKIVFAFLRDKELINAPYREIAEQAQVALGAVGGVIKDLTAQGLLLEGTKKKQREIANVDLLLKKWVEAYPHKLQDKYRIGMFTTDNPDWWKMINPEEFDALWGGEFAAEKYTDYLNPKNAIVYINRKNMADFLKAARLRKPEPDERPEIIIELIEPFWNTKAKVTTNLEQKGLAHPIITYADLIETGDARNLDTANRLREKYIH